MMLEHLGESKAARAIESALQSALANAELHTPDLGGKAGTRDVGEAVAGSIAAGGAMG